MNNDFDRNGVLAWWKGLRQSNSDSATMRHSKEIGDLFLTSQFYDLIKKIDCSDRNYDQVAAATFVICRIQNNTKQSVASLMGKNVPKRKTQTVAPERFMHLVTSDGREETARYLVTLLPMTDWSANVIDTFETIFYWGENAKRKWAQDYYTANDVKKEEKE